MPTYSDTSYYGSQYGSGGGWGDPHTFGASHQPFGSVNMSKSSGGTNWLGLAGLAIGGTGYYLSYKEQKKMRKQQESQFRRMMDAYNKPSSDPKPLQQAGGEVSAVPRGRTTPKKRKAKGPSKTNQGLLSVSSEPSLLGVSR